MFVISLRCCTEFSPFPLYISRSQGGEEGSWGPRAGEEGGRARRGSGDLSEASKKVACERQGGNLPGTCLKLQTNSEGECYGSKEIKRKQQEPSSSKEPGASSLFFHSCCAPRAGKKIHQKASAFVPALQERLQLSVLL